MRVSDHNRRLLDGLRDAVAGFGEGKLGLDRIQAELQSAVGLLENDGTGVIGMVRLAEADVEEIRFTRILDEQRPAIALRLAQLLDTLPSDG